MKNNNEINININELAKELATLWDDHKGDVKEIEAALKKYTWMEEARPLLRNIGDQAKQMLWLMWTEKDRKATKKIIAKLKTKKYLLKASRVDEIGRGSSHYDLREYYIRTSDPNVVSICRDKKGFEQLEGYYSYEYKIDG